MTLELLIQSREAITDRISLFTFTAKAGTLPAYSPGAHLDFDLGEVGTRSYSLIDFAPVTDSPQTYQIAVQREDKGEGGSRAMHSLKPGNELTASAPKDDFTLHKGNAPALLLAGGIGVTPILSFATALKARGTPYQFQFTTRAAALTPFADVLSAAHCDAFSLWHDDSNPLDLGAVIAATDHASHIYCCGPKGMIDAVRSIAEGAGFAADHIHFELFTTAAPATGDQPFEVEIKDTGQVFTIPVGKTIVEVLEDEGIDLIYDCQRGDCGICQTDVVSGTPDHRDVVLSQAEREAGNIMQICVSRAKSARLVLDL